MHLKLLGWLGLLLAPLVQAKDALSHYKFERGLMGTRFEVSCYSTDLPQAKAAADAAFDAASDINQVASDYIVDSELLKLSKHPPGEAVVVSPLLFKLISEAQEFAEKTAGSFDPTLGPLTKLWRESRRRKSLPTPSTLALARAATGWKSLSLNPTNSTVTFAKPGMRLDLGGIGKGQAADAMLVVMIAHGVPCCCITAGGDVRLGTAPPASEGWKIEVRSTLEPGNKILTLANCGISTAGDLHQFVEIDGSRYSHIIDPMTGLGLTHPAAVTIVAPTATMSDAIDTAYCTAPAATAVKMAYAAGATQVIPAE